MKRLTAEEFARKVMENGTELEWNDIDRSIEIYAHIDEDGNLVNNHSAAEWTIYSIVRLDDEEKEDKMLNGELDDEEKEIIMSDLYPQYLEIIEENF